MTTDDWVWGLQLLDAASIDSRIQILRGARAGHPGVRRPHRFVDAAALHVPDSRGNGRRDPLARRASIWARTHRGLGDLWDIGHRGSEPFDRTSGERSDASAPSITRTERGLGERCSSTYHSQPRRSSSSLIVKQPSRKHMDNRSALADKATLIQLLTTDREYNIEVCWCKQVPIVPAAQNMTAGLGQRGVRLCRWYA